jgi:hypothetical protein
VLPLLSWLIQGAVGPALVGLPVSWAGTDLAGAARRWFRRLRRTDDLGRIVRAASGGDVDLSDAEFAAIRRLLEQESTWLLIGSGPVEDLAAMIAACLPGRTAAKSMTAGRAIVGGLLEFAVRSLEPQWFQQVLFARLDRIQADQAAALDHAMLSVHADLAALLALQTEAGTDRFSRVMGQLERVLDLSPPGPADQGQVAIYLATLIRWLNTDPWPQDSRFGGSVLAPAEVERKLGIAIGDDLSEEYVDADDLARRSARLVVLGGPGSGKTWLARRAARLCAEAALEALAAGSTPDEVELPLYTTCARLSGSPPGENIRRAVVSSALGQLPDLGGSRVHDALRVLFENRDGPTLLVVDSLDEARGGDDRIRQADTLPTAWRIVLTSRPGSWHRQLTISDGDPTRLTGTLQPLSYPYDVEPFIASWFSGRPEWAAHLTAQLRNRPALQQAATVPLILAFYCIVGGDQPLPDRRSELYAKVIRRMLTGRWRGSSDRDPDPDACLETLREWAWSAADSDPVSAVGAWADEFSTARVRQSPDDRDALDHVAVPLGPPDTDTGMTLRRFVHRSVREHLVAEHVALRMTPEEATEELLNHLWYDPDWENAAPAALAMHPDRDHILKKLLERLTGRAELNAELSAVDSCGEVRRFLARVALESSENDWSAEASGIIGRARMDLVAAGNLEYVPQAALSWANSNGSIREALLSLLAREADIDEADSYRALKLAEAVVVLDPTEQEREQARKDLLKLLRRDYEYGWEDVRAMYAWPAWHLVEALAVLDATDEERAQARRALLRFLARETDDWQAEGLTTALNCLEPTEQERARARSAVLGLLVSYPSQELGDLAAALAGLAPTPGERTRTRKTLLWRLTRAADGPSASRLTDALARLDPTEQDWGRAREALLRRLSRRADSQLVWELAQTLAGLYPTERDWVRARKALLRRLTLEPDSREALGLAEALVRLRMTAKDRTRARQALVGLFSREADSRLTWELAQALVGLDPTDHDRAQASQAVLGQLAQETDSSRARELAQVLLRLVATAREQARVRETLLGRLVQETESRPAAQLTGAQARSAALEERTRVTQLDLVDRAMGSWQAFRLTEALAGLDMTEQEIAQARNVLLGLLARETVALSALPLVQALTRLGMAPPDTMRARDLLLGLLVRETDSWPALQLVQALTRLGMTAKDSAQAREALLRLLGHKTHSQPVSKLTEALAGLDPTEQDRLRAQQALHAQLKSDSWDAPEIALAMAKNAAGPKDRAQAHEAMVELLARSADAWWRVQKLPRALAGIAVTAEERMRTREALLGLLGRETDSYMARELAKALAGIAVTAEDRALAQQALLELLGRDQTAGQSRELIEVLAGLAVTAEEEMRARKGLLRLLIRETNTWRARAIEDAVSRLNPTVSDLEGSHAFAARPTSILLAAMRKNSALPAWLASLPKLSGLQAHNEDAEPLTVTP